MRNGDLLEPQEFQVVILPNLIANVTGDPFEGIIVAGDAGKAKVRIANNGAALAETILNVKLYLSKTGGDDPNGTMFDSSDLLVGQILNGAISVRAGKSVVLSADLNVPTMLVTQPGETYRLIAAIEPAGAPITQLFTDDDNGIDGRVHKWENLFGDFEDQSFGGRKHVSLTYAEEDGDVVTLSMRGAGAGQLTITDGLPDVAITGTNGSSVFKGVVNGNGERILELNRLSVSQAIRSVLLDDASIASSVALSGGAKSILLHAIGSEEDSTLLIGTFSPNSEQRVNISLGHVRNVSIDSLMPIKGFVALDWLDTAGASDSMIARSLGRLNVSGDFEADITLTGDDKLASLTVNGFVRNATIRTEGDVGRVRIGGMDHAQLLIGTDSRPETHSEFTSNQTLQSFTITGVAAETTLFLQSQIVAQRFGSISVVGIEGDAGGERFGFVADAIKRYNRSGTALRNLEEPGVFDENGDYALVIL